MWMFSSWGPLVGGLVVLISSLTALKVNNWSDERAQRFDDWAAVNSGCMASCARKHTVKRFTFHTSTGVAGLAIFIQIVAGAAFVFLVAQLVSCFLCIFACVCVCVNASMRLCVYVSMCLCGCVCVVCLTRESSQDNYRSRSNEFLIQKLGRGS
jgi:hypothetical protein